ncbi:cation transporter [Methylobacterium nigriterrae]|uniref:cation transporter n=1 Tax=Methylobacterium nigriterrae TaxID=3127512 RepID=UPI00301397E0
MPLHLDAQMPKTTRGYGYKKTVWGIAAGILLLALVEAAWAHAIGSKDLLKDASGFGYDIALNAVAAFVFGRGARAERLSAFVIGGLLAATGIDALADLWSDIQHPDASSVGEIVTSNLVGVAVACFAAAALVRFRNDANPLIQATWLNARNDASAAVLTAVLGLLAHMAPVRWPEYALDLIGVIFSFQAAATVLRAAWRKLETSPEAEVWTDTALSPVDR